MPQTTDTRVRDLPVTDPGDLVAALVAIGSVSGHEQQIADEVEQVLRPLSHVEVLRDGNCVLARTQLGRDTRALIAGHLDTVPMPRSGPIVSRVTDGTLWARGAVDMLGGVAMALHLAVTVADPVMDMTYVFYDNEEVEAARNGLTRLATTHRAWLDADVAILGEPTDNRIEGGCQGSLTVSVNVSGRAGHAARAWRADNAIHKAGLIVAAVRDHPARRPTVDGLQFHEGLQVVRVSGGTQATNVVPDSCTLLVNHRFAPDHDVDAAIATVLAVVHGAVGPDEAEVTVLDAAPGARPGLDSAAVAGFAAVVGTATGHPPTAKLGWTDVARFSALGIPAVNFGPGDPMLAHADDERVALTDVRTATDLVRRWIAGG